MCIKIYRETRIYTRITDSIISTTSEHNWVNRSIVNYTYEKNI